MSKKRAWMPRSRIKSAICALCLFAKLVWRLYDESDPQSRIGFRTAWSIAFGVWRPEMRCVCFKCGGKGCPRCGGTGVLVRDVSWLPWKDSIKAAAKGEVL